MKDIQNQGYINKDFMYLGEKKISYLLIIAISILLKNIHIGNQTI